jgi:AcrR family transcriptional regulator
VRKLKTARQAEIVDAALALAEEKGLDALSMRSVAGRLDLTPMALYGYFRSKDDLLDGIVGHLMTQLPHPDPTLSWNLQLRRLAHGAREVASQYPAVFPLLFVRPSVTPDAVRAVDGLYVVLLDAGVPPVHVARVERLVSTFVIGFAISEVSGRFSGGPANPRAGRALIGDEMLPGHARLSVQLGREVDWDAEFEADLDDLQRVVESYLDGA